MNNRLRAINIIRKMLGVKFFTPLPWEKENKDEERSYYNQFSKGIYFANGKTYFLDRNVKYKYPIK